MNLVDKIIFLSEELEEYFKNIVNEEKKEVVYNSIVIPDNKKIRILKKFCFWVDLVKEIENNIERILAIYENI